MKPLIFAIVASLLLSSCASTINQSGNRQVNTPVSSLHLSTLPTSVVSVSATQEEKIELHEVRGDIGIGEVAIGQDNSLWALSGEKLLVYRNNDWNEYIIPSELTFCAPSDLVTINNLALGTDDSVWIGCRCRLLRFDGKEWTAYSSETGIAEGEISDIAADTLGNLWVGTHKGNVSK
jgi:ligand-binding sensor domain-containing protein